MLKLYCKLIYGEDLDIIFIIPEGLLNDPVKNSEEGSRKIPELLCVFFDARKNLLFIFLFNKADIK
jgi:hypothetical protein